MDTFTIPLKFEDRRMAVGRNSLTNLASAPTWVDVWSALELNRIPDASSLAQLALPQFHILADAAPFGELITALWQAVRIELAQTPGISAPKLAFCNETASLPAALRAPSADTSISGQGLPAREQPLGIPGYFDAIGPSARVADLESAPPTPDAMRAFSRAGLARISWNRRALLYPPWRRVPLATFRSVPSRVSPLFRLRVELCADGALCLARAARLAYKWATSRGISRFWEWILHGAMTQYARRPWGSIINREPRAFITLLLQGVLAF